MRLTTYFTILSLGKAIRNINIKHKQIEKSVPEDYRPDRGATGLVETGLTNLDCIIDITLLKFNR